jgi:hypothetical protein
VTLILGDPVTETRRILQAAEATAVPLRAVGGVAIALIAPSIVRLDPPRVYHDIDLVAPSGTPAVGRLLVDLGYQAARRFNTLKGSERLLFHDNDGRRIDVFIDTLRMCHTLEFRRRISLQPMTLPAVDLLLSKLQIVELTDRDAQDVAALLADHPLTTSDGDGIDMRRMREICGNDWGWWRTVDGNLGRLAERWVAARAAADLDGSQVLGTALVRGNELRQTLASLPKSARWTMRAVIGARLRWYDEPEEIR